MAMALSFTALLVSAHDHGALVHISSCESSRKRHCLTVHVNICSTSRSAESVTAQPAPFCVTSNYVTASQTGARNPVNLISKPITLEAFRFDEPLGVKALVNYVLMSAYVSQLCHTRK